MAMISRRKIISRSQSELDYPHNVYDVDEDVWFSKDKLFQDHITEILKKWDQIDDEIWGKIICMERNRRIAKAYSRVPVLTISGSDDGFDGYKIGLNGFDNPMRDSLTKTVKSHIGKGVRLKMDDMGNIVIKRMSNCDVFIRGWDRENNSLSQEIVDLSGELEFEKSVKLFDMKKFQACIARELRSAYPDRRKLENQCICAIAFVKDSNDLLDQCCWVLLINIVALDLLKSRFPTILFNRGVPSDPELALRSAPKFVSVFSQAERRDALVSEEDPYSLPLPSAGVSRGDRLTSEKVDRDRKGRSTSSTSNSSSSETKPPELPPRDFAKIKKSKGKNLPQAIKSLVKSNGKSVDKSTGESRATAATAGNVTADEKRRQEIEYEDPYYCGLQARVPNFAANRGQRKAPANPVVHNGSHIANSINNSVYNIQSRSQPFDIRKSQSNGYLNSLFNQSSNHSSSFFPLLHKKLDANKRTNSSFNSNPYYDSSLDSDAYGISGSGSGYDMYAPLNTHLYGRMRAQLHANGQVVSSAKSSNSKVTGGKSSNGGNNANVTTAVTSNGNSNSKTTNGNRRTNDKPSSGLKKTAPPPSALIYPNERYATEWD